MSHVQAICGSFKIYQVGGRRRSPSTLDIPYMVGSWLVHGVCTADAWLKCASIWPQRADVNLVTRITGIMVYKTMMYLYIYIYMYIYIHIYI